MVSTYVDLRRTENVFIGPNRVIGQIHRHDIGFTLANLLSGFDIKLRQQPGGLRIAGFGEVKNASPVEFRSKAENLEMRRDASKRHEIRSRERSFGKMVRNAVKQKNNR